MDLRNSSRRSPPHVWALLATFVMVAAACGNWPTLGHGPERSGDNPLETALRVDNVDELHELWSADAGGVSPAIVANGFVFVQHAGAVAAYSADGSDGCSGSPRACVPLWTTTAGAGPTAPTVAGNVLYVSSFNVLSAFDARGVTGCSGTPKTCSPLWTARTGSIASPGPGISAPVVANGVVYITSDQLYAFDAAGASGCGGVSKTCAPLWTAPSGGGSTVSVAHGVVYAVARDRLAAFDAAGTSGCSGSPKTCDALWTHPRDISFCSGSCGLSGPPSIVGGRIYVADTSCCSGGLSSTQLIALDEAAAQNCSGVPKTCQPVATRSTSVGGLSLYVGPPAIAHDSLYANDGRLLALTATQLSDVWTGTGIVVSSPTHANGVVYAIGGSLVGGQTSQIRLFPVAYDAAGDVGCSGSPKTCAPLWSGPLGPPVDVLSTVFSDLVGPTVADGIVYVRTDRLRAYALE